MRQQARFAYSHQQTDGCVRSQTHRQRLDVGARAAFHYRQADFEDVPAQIPGDFHRELRCYRHVRKAGEHGWQGLALYRSKEVLSTTRPAFSTHRGFRASPVCCFHYPHELFVVWRKLDTIRCFCNVERITFLDTEFSENFLRQHDSDRASDRCDFHDCAHLEPLFVITLIIIAAKGRKSALWALFSFTEIMKPKLQIHHRIFNCAAYIPIRLSQTAHSLLLVDIGLQHDQGNRHTASRGFDGAYGQVAIDVAGAHQDADAALD